MPKKNARPLNNKKPSAQTQRDSTKRPEQLELPYIPRFSISDLKMPVCRNDIWVAQMLVKGERVNQDTWDSITGGTDIRPFIYNLRERGWPIDADKVWMPRGKMQNRYINDYFLANPQRRVIYRALAKAKLLEG
jgi:hypothetical protein